MTIPLVEGQCTTPLTADGNSTIAPPVLDSQSTGFIVNPNAQNSNDTRFLSFRISWATVSNRVLTWVGIGDDSSANGGCQSTVNENGGWKFSSSSDCADEVRANYTWPSTLYASSCAPFFTVDNSNDRLTRITFDLVVKFNETYNISRAGNRFTIVKTISSKLPVTLEYPKTVSVSTSSVRIYSSSSLSITASLISQEITNTLPYNITFITLVGRSFALNNPIVNYGGANSPLFISTSFSGDDIISTTRQSTWKMAITPMPNVCLLTGRYNITFNLYWTGVDANGNPLPANQNPLPNNSTAIAIFDIQSQSFCSTTITSSLVPTLSVYDVPPSPTTYYSDVSETRGFLINQRIYFRSQVTSSNLPVKSVRLTHFWITWGATNRTDLVINGAQSTSTAPDIDYQPSLTLTAQPNNQFLFNMLMTSNVFQVLQDQDTQFTFNALLAVTYSTTGSKKKRDLTKMSLSYFKRGLPTVASTSITSIIVVTVKPETPAPSRGVTNTSPPLSSTNKPTSTSASHSPSPSPGSALSHTLGATSASSSAYDGLVKCFTLLAVLTLLFW